MRSSSSSARRIAATRPSIMSLGATMSAPARARLAAVCASRSSDESFSTSQPSLVSTIIPQCPWLVYSHRHTSPISTSFFPALDRFRARSALLHDARHRPRLRSPCSSFDAGNPNSSSPATPSPATSSASFTASSTERLNTPGIEPMGLRTPSPGQMKRG